MPAHKMKSWLKLLLTGASKSGKTYTGLEIAQEIARLEGGKIALVDTESGKSSLYAPPFTFDVLTLVDNYHPEQYIRAIQDACAYGYSVLIIDSASQMWNAEHGILSIVDNSKRGKFGGWSEATPLYRKFLRVLMSAPIHAIVTTRAQSEYELRKNTKGKDVYVEVGTNPIQHKEFKFEFDVHMMMEPVHHAMRVDGTRYSPIDGLEISDSVWLAQELHAWITGGVAPAPRKAGETWLTGDFVNDLIAEFEITEDQRPLYLAAAGVEAGGSLADSYLSIGEFRQAFADTYSKLNTGDDNSAA
ncbi:MAG: AAA family ATPase [Aggregatilineales bacterium]